MEKFQKSQKILIILKGTGLHDAEIGKNFNFRGLKRWQKFDFGMRVYCEYFPTVL